LTPAIDWVVVGGDLARWHRLGLVSMPAGGDRAQIPLFGTGIEVAADPGAVSLVMSGIATATSLDGVAVEVRRQAAPLLATHPLGATAIDHVVIVTDDLARTSGAVAEATGAALKRVREAGEMRQGFHRLGGLVVEIVERRGLQPGPASVWGLALVVEDLDAACAGLGRDLVSEPRDAVQPGRRIATVHRAAGVGLAMALMSRDPR
jgi:hypothetical protein